MGELHHDNPESRVLSSEVSQPAPAKVPAGDKELEASVTEQIKWARRTIGGLCLFHGLNGLSVFICSLSIFIGDYFFSGLSIGVLSIIHSIIGIVLCAKVIKRSKRSTSSMVYAGLTLCCIVCFFYIIIILSLIIPF